MNRIALVVAYDAFTHKAHGTGYLDLWVTLACFFAAERLVVIDPQGLAHAWLMNLAIPSTSDRGALTRVRRLVSEGQAIDELLNWSWVYVEQPRKLKDTHAVDVSSLVDYRHEGIRDTVYAFGPNAQGWNVRPRDARAFLTIEAPNDFPGLWSVEAAAMVLYDRVAKSGRSYWEHGTDATPQKV